VSPAISVAAAGKKPPQAPWLVLLLLYDRFSGKGF
jgi:hypothetical protein